jgi:hypothetical protein
MTPPLSLTPYCSQKRDAVSVLRSLRSAPHLPDSATESEPRFSNPHTCAGRRWSHPYPCPTPGAPSPLWPSSTRPLRPSTATTTSLGERPHRIVRGSRRGDRHSSQAPVRRRSAESPWPPTTDERQRRRCRLRVPCARIEEEEMALAKFTSN